MAPGRKKPAMAVRNWAIGDLVLAKVRGYPAWPAKVSAPEKHKMSPRASKVFVEYFGTKDFGFVQSGEVSEFTPDVRSVILKKAKNTVNGRLHNCFRSAVNEICKLSDKRLQNSGEEEDGEEEHQRISSPGEEIRKEAPGSRGEYEGESDATGCGEVVDEGGVKQQQEDESIRDEDDAMDSFACLAMAAEAAACENEQQDEDEAAAAAAVVIEGLRSGELLDEKPKVVKTFERRKKAMVKECEAKVLKTFERRKKLESEQEIKASENSEPKPEPRASEEPKTSEPTPEPRISQEPRASEPEVKQEMKTETKLPGEKASTNAKVEKTFKREFSRKMMPEPEKKVFKRELMRKVPEAEEGKLSKKLKPDVSGEVVKKRSRKEEQRKEESLPPPKRTKSTKSPGRTPRENSEKVKPKPAPVVKEVKMIAPTVIVPVPTRLMEAETNKVREAYEAAKEMRQRLAQKEESVSASVKFLQAAAQAKRMNSGSNQDSALFMRPEKPSPSSQQQHHHQQQHQQHQHQQQQQQQQHHSGEKPGFFYSRKEGTLDSFQTTLETLTGTHESILKATRHALRCANKGYEKKVMQIIMRKLQNEADHRKRIDLLFLVESITRGSNGAGYCRIVEAWLGRLLTAVAPPNSPLENHKQCLKVVGLWLKRKSMQESLLNDFIAKIEAGLNTRKRQHQREDRAVDDPVREIDDMLVDEYGSNAGFQLPGLLARRVDDEDEEPGAPETSAAHTAPSSPENNRRAVILEDLDGELEMEDVSPPRNDETRVNSLARLDEVEARPEPVPLPASSPPPLPESPPPSSPPRPPNSPSPHSSLLHQQHQQQQQHH